jgi:homoserine dehydrogenase
MTSQAFRLGIAGLGTVGAGVVDILQTHGEEIAARAGRPIEIVGVNARSKTKDRGVDLSGYNWVDNAEDLADSNTIDAVVEMIGGHEGAAYTLAKNALSRGLHVVTANKALLAYHGGELAATAEQNNVNIAYEAAVAGGIPIIKAMREGFAANRIDGVYGILNGTCNYILTQMRETGKDFDTVLKEAQDLGYAEADPALDVGGGDAGHKLALLSAIAFGIRPDFTSLNVQGISDITETDITVASELGYRIKLLGMAKRAEGGFMQTLEPCLVPIESTLGAIEGVFNAVMVQGDFVDNALLVGRGAGAGPTASAVVADIIDLARGINVPAFGKPVAQLDEASWMDLGQCEGAYYVRLNMIDQPGVIAEVTAILRDHDVSIESFIQHGRDPGQAVSVVLTTHQAKQSNLQTACGLIENLEACKNKPCVMRIENI